jgi:hypothetical protein
MLNGLISVYELARAPGRERGGWRRTVRKTAAKQKDRYVQRLDFRLRTRESAREEERGLETHSAQDCSKTQRIGMLNGLISVYELARAHGVSGERLDDFWRES